MRVIPLLAAFALGAAGAGISETIEGRLVHREGKPPAVETSGHGVVSLEGDEHTRKVLEDPRLGGMEIQARGRYLEPGRFQVEPIHTRAVLVRKDGRLKLVSYWCDICSIRTYSPGPCWCCQRESTLELREPDPR